MSRDRYGLTQLDRVMGRKESRSHMMSRLAEEGRNADGSMDNCKVCFVGIVCAIPVLIYVGTCCSYPICGVPFWSVCLLVSGIIYGLNHHRNIFGLAENLRSLNDNPEDQFTQESVDLFTTMAMGGSAALLVISLLRIAWDLWCNKKPREPQLDEDRV